MQEPKKPNVGYVPLCGFHFPVIRYSYFKLKKKDIIGPIKISDFKVQNADFSQL